MPMDAQLSEKKLWGVISGNITPPPRGGAPQIGPKKSRFKNGLVDCLFGLLSSRGRYINHRHKLVEAVSNKIVPELIVWRSAETIDFLLDQAQY